jgi:hypothetical protein
MERAAQPLENSPIFFQLFGGRLCCHCLPCPFIYWKGARGGQGIVYKYHLLFFAQHKFQKFGG